MARDRQRAKQRRRRQPGAGGPVTGSSRARARESGLEPTDAELGNTPPPEPRGEAGDERSEAGHGMPHVEEARMAEAGVPPFDEDDRVASAPDEVQAGSAYTDPAVLEERAGPRRQRGKVLGFLGHVVDELRRVRWPDRRQTGQGTAVTLGFVVIAGGFLGLMDAIWRPLVEAIL